MAVKAPEDRLVAGLVVILRGLDESVEPWKLRPPNTDGDPVKLLVETRVSLVRGRLVGEGYIVGDL